MNSVKDEETRGDDSVAELSFDCGDARQRRMQLERIQLWV